MRGAGCPDSDVTTSDVAACQGSAAGAGRPVQQDLGRRGGRRAALHTSGRVGRQAQVGACTAERRLLAAKADVAVVTTSAAHHSR